MLATIEKQSNHHIATFKRPLPHLKMPFGPP